jgi:hypothetical protein
MVVPIVLVVVAFTIISQAPGNGADHSQAINPNPISPAAEYLSDLKRFANTQDYLLQNGPTNFDKVSGSLDKLKKLLDEKYANHSKYTEAIGLIATMQTELSQIRNNVAGQPTVAKQNAVKFMADSAALETLMATITGNASGTASVDDSPADLSFCAKLLNEPDKVKIAQPNDKEGLKTGKITRKDHVVVDLDPKVCKFVSTLVDNGIYPLTLTSLVGNHDQAVHSAKGNQSRHWTGHAVDIGEPRGGVSVAAKVMPWVIANQAKLNEASIMPRQVIGPVKSVSDGKNYSGLEINGGKPAPGFYLKDHDNHVHIGY